MQPLKQRHGHHANCVYAAPATPTAQCDVTESGGKNEQHSHTCVTGQALNTHEAGCDLLSQGNREQQCPSACGVLAATADRKAELPTDRQEGPPQDQSVTKGKTMTLEDKNAQISMQSPNKDIKPQTINHGSISDKAAWSESPPGSFRVVSRKGQAGPS